MLNTKKEIEEELKNFEEPDSCWSPLTYSREINIIEVYIWIINCLILKEKDFFF